MASIPEDRARRPARRLAAILAADVAGFSRLMGIDERGTFERLKALRRDIVDPAVADHAGRIVKLMGDGLLAEFASAVDAVECATAIQRGMAASHGEVPDDRRIQVRIGINLGDIIVEGRDIYGDGVNVAARIEALAEPGGIAISEDVHRYVRNKIDTPFADLGDRQLKNIAGPVRVYQAAARLFAPGAVPADPLHTPEPIAPAAPADKPSIVVLPLENMSGDPEQAYFSDGLAEDLITDLSKISGLFVIARNTAFTYRGQALNLTEVCGELGVRFALEGSVRRAGNRVRITTQLIDGPSGGHVWAERYDRELTDIFAVQDEVTREIVAALKVHLTPEERRRVASRGTQNIEAYDRFLRGRQLFFETTRETIARAQALFEEAIRLDPKFGAAQAYLAFSHTVQSLNRWTADPAESMRQAQLLIEHALRLDPNDAEAHCVQGTIHLWATRRFDLAIADEERAVALDPNFARAYGTLAEVLHYAGRSEEALQHFATMARLDPHHPPQYLHFLAQTLFVLGRYEEAVEQTKARLARQPYSDVGHVLLAACYGHLGRAEEARAAWAEALRLNPDYSIEHRRQILPYKNPADFELVVEGLRKAGIAA